MAAIFLALLAAIFYGGADFLGGLAARRSSVTPVLIFSQLAGLATLLLVLPLLPATAASRTDFAWGAVAGCAAGMGLMLLYQGLASGKMSLVAPVTAVLAVVVSSAVGAVLGDRLSTSAFAGVALALTAIALISQDGVPEKTAGAPPGVARGFVAALSAGVLIGVFFAALKQSNVASGLLPLLSARLATLFAVGAIALARRTPLRVGRDEVWLIVFCGVLDIFANVLYLLAARHGMLTVAATLTSLYPASTIVLARLILGERLQGIQIAGLSCAGFGVVLIGIG
jgi:drug/metabolite transporter (DMT)-like permease